MSVSHITILSDSETESIGSSALYVILSDSEAAVGVVPAVVPKIAPETKTEPSEAPPSLVYAPGSPDYAPASDDDTESLEALASPDYSLVSDTQSDSSKADP
ncbi:hypothetical protein Tco_0585509 [Tanacetum coccineum]